MKATDPLAPRAGRFPLATPAAVLESELSPDRLASHRVPKRVRKDQAELWHEVVRTRGEFTDLPLSGRHPALLFMLPAVRKVEVDIAALIDSPGYRTRGQARALIASGYGLADSTLDQALRGVAWMNFFTYCQIVASPR